MNPSWQVSCFIFPPSQAHPDQFYFLALQLCSTGDRVAAEHRQNSD